MDTSTFFDMGRTEALNELGLVKFANGLMGLAPEAWKHVGMRAAGGAAAGGLAGGLSAGEDNRMSGALTGALTGGALGGGLSVFSKKMIPGVDKAENMGGQFIEAEKQRYLTQGALATALGAAPLGALGGMGAGLMHDSRKQANVESYMPELKHIGLRALGGAAGGGAVGAYRDDDNRLNGALGGALLGGTVAGGISAGSRLSNISGMRNLHTPEALAETASAQKLLNNMDTIPAGIRNDEALEAALNNLNRRNAVMGESNRIRADLATPGGPAVTGLGGALSGAAGTALLGSAPERRE